MTIQETWMLDIDGDLEIPGWVFIPELHDEAQRARWSLDTAELLVQTEFGVAWSSVGVATHDVATALEAAAAFRLTSPVLAMFQVWLTSIPSATMCHVAIVPSADLPDFSTVPGLDVQPFSAPHLGEGLQCTTSELVEAEGSQFREVGVHLVFDNGDTSVVLSLESAPEMLTSAALPGLAALAAVLKATSNGRNFTGVARHEIVGGDEWASLAASPGKTAAL